MTRMGELSFRKSIRRLKIRESILNSAKCRKHREIRRRARDAEIIIEFYVIEFSLVRKVSVCEEGEGGGS